MNRLATANKIQMAALALGILAACTAAPSPVPSPTHSAISTSPPAASSQAAASGLPIFHGSVPPATLATVGTPAVSATPRSTPWTAFVPPAAHDGALGVTVTLPNSGWRYDDIARGFTTGLEMNNLPEATVLLWTFPAGTEFWVYGDPCHWVSTKPGTPASTAGDIVAGLAAQPSRDASELADVTVGGYAGKSITLHVPEDAVLDSCDSGDFASYGVTGDEPTRYHQGPGQIDEFWVVDVDGAIAVIDATYRPDTPAELVEEMRGIAQSTTFDTP